MSRVSLLFSLMLTVAAHGDLLVVSFVTDSILRYNETTGEFLGVFVSSGSGGLDEPYAFAVGPDGNLYVASFQTDSVKRYDFKDGGFLGDFVSPGSGGLNGPTGLIFGPDVNGDDKPDLYVLSGFTHEVLAYDGLTGNFICVSASGNGLSGPAGLAFDSAGNYLYVSSNDTHDVKRFDAVCSSAPNPAGSFATGGLSNPHDPVFGPDYNLYVASHTNHSVVRFNGRTGAFIDAFVFSGSGGLSKAQGLTFGPDKTGDHWPELYVASENTNSVKVYDGKTGAFLSDFVPSGSGGLNLPSFLLFVDVAQSCPADIDNDGVVGINDFLDLLAAWGLCP